MPIKIKFESNPSSGSIDGNGALSYTPTYIDSAGISYSAPKLQAALAGYDYPGDNETEDESLYYKINKPVGTYSLQSLIEYAESKANPYDTLEVGRSIDALGAISKEFLLSALYLVHEGYCSSDDLITLTDNKYGSIREWLIDKLDAESAGADNMFILGYLYTVHRNKLLGYLEDLSSIKIKKQNDGWTEISKADWATFSAQAKKCYFIKDTSVPTYKMTVSGPYCVMKPKFAMEKYLNVYVFSNKQPRSGGYYSTANDNRLASRMFADNFVSETGTYVTNGATTSDSITAYRKYDGIYLSDIIYDFLINKGDNFAIVSSSTADSITTTTYKNLLSDSLTISALDSNGWTANSALTQYRSSSADTMKNLLISQSYGTSTDYASVTDDYKNYERSLLEKIAGKIANGLTGQSGYGLFVEGYDSELMGFVSSYCDLLAATTEESSVTNTAGTAVTKRQAITQFVINALPKSSEAKYRSRMRSILVSAGLSKVKVPDIDSASEQTYYRARLRSCVKTFIGQCGSSLEDEVFTLLYAVAYMDYYDWLFDTTGFGSLSDNAKSQLWNTFSPEVSTSDAALNSCMTRVLSALYVLGKEYSKAIKAIPYLFSYDCLISASTKDDPSCAITKVKRIITVTPKVTIMVAKTPSTNTHIKLATDSKTTPISIKVKKTSSTGTSTLSSSSSSSSTKAVASAEKTVVRLTGITKRTLTKLKG